MKMYLDTSTPTCILKLDDKEYAWESGKELAEGLHAFIRDKLVENGADWKDLTEITYFAGPGSFTGLRIGAAVVNTLADQLDIPLYTDKGEKVPVIMPNYGRPARITPPRK
ncbi:tRNA (adenosine(37)-N6)-threonylcarbamoyltransferase complex dimerization subunit type 1 TsaB [Candidatus Saccharibacteria bacterium]|nr:tRNA (adenosine(37)-N6)-threonylcarbamoyltransferase complex dimerization subunit type 1 TsaB [Candidatus Saccharibacteria bacterium]